MPPTQQAGGAAAPATAPNRERHPVRVVPVELPSATYDVLIGHNLLDELGTLAAAVCKGCSGRVFVAADEHLPPSTVERALRSLRAAGASVTCYAMPSAERAKSLQTLEGLLAEIARTRHERLDPIVALGGGLVGDVVGLAAALYRRGVPLIQCPTTLLSMVDASVGGKTAVNLDAGPEQGGGGGLKKNLIGAFHQPALVVTDVDTVRSLPERQLRSGLAECVKHAMIGADWGDAGLMQWTEVNLDQILARDHRALSELIARNVAIKAAVVKTDEREEADPATGGRALLNLGHTYAHAIETIPNISPDGDPSQAPLHHGEAVGLGMMAAARCAEAMGLCNTLLGDHLERVLRWIGLPVRVAGLPGHDEILTRMAHDKKVSGGKLRLVLPVELGRAKVVDDPPLEAVVAGFDAIRLEAA